MIMLMAWLRTVLKFLERRLRSKKFHRQSQTVATPNCPRCGAAMRHVGTIPHIYSVDGPTLVFRCDPCGEWTEIQGWPP
jgi:hypothetical protein